MGRTSFRPSPAAPAIQGPMLSRPLAPLKAHVMMSWLGRFSYPSLYPMLMCSAPCYCANRLQSASLRAVARCMRFTTEKRCGGGQVYCFPVQVTTAASRSHPRRLWNGNETSCHIQCEASLKAGPDTAKPGSGCRFSILPSYFVPIHASSGPMAEGAEGWCVEGRNA